MVQEQREFPIDGTPTPPATPAPSVRRASAPFAEGEHWYIYARSELVPGNFAVGPCVITETNSTTYVPVGWNFSVQATGDLILTHAKIPELPTSETQPEEVELELFTNRFYEMCIRDR